MRCCGRSLEMKPWWYRACLHSFYQHGVLLSAATIPALAPGTTLPIGQARRAPKSQHIWKFQLTPSLAELSREQQLLLAVMQAVKPAGRGKGPPQSSPRCANTYPAAQEQQDDAAPAQGGTGGNVAQGGQRQRSAMGHRSQSKHPLPVDRFWGYHFSRPLMDFKHNLLC